MFTLATVLSALELGFIYALVALALFLSFRVLNIADMTTDGAFTLGCAVSATAAVAGHPFLGLPLALLAGAAAGFVTAFCKRGWRCRPFWRASSPTQGCTPSTWRSWGFPPTYLC